MFDSFVQWMVMPGKWNDGVVFLGLVVTVLVFALIFIKEEK